MYDQNIETLRQEAQRLLTVEINLLNDMMLARGVIAEAQAGQPQTFDQTTISKHIEMLKEEIIKLGNLDMVIAVVGTMKAGKSTTINAIVGSELMPHRHSAMTALPTLIRHTPGKTEPLLKFENIQPIHRLMKDLRNAINHPDNSTRVENQKVDIDMKALINVISNVEWLKESYEGKDAIFKFLKELNDLVRLSKEMNIEFPFFDYTQISQIPVIEIEFVSLTECGGIEKGRLMLLDTPGPNESGQEHLREMLENQIKKATVVLAVLDFNHLNSEADAEIRKKLEEIAKIANEKIYVLINKIDELKADCSYTVEDVISTVAIELSTPELNISKSFIFPVSSFYAYLANRARCEFKNNNRLPNPDDQKWVQDFGVKSFGFTWNKAISNQENVSNGIEYLWGQSRFDALLKTIRKVYDDKVIITIDAAAAKIAYTAKEISNLLVMRKKGLNKDIEALNADINRLKEKLKDIESSQLEILQKTQNQLEKTQDTINQGIESTKKDICVILERYFKEGKAIEKNVRQLESEKSKNFPTFQNAYYALKNFVIGGKADFRPK